MNVPDALRSGDTWSWTESLSGYSATEYTLRVAFWRYGQPVKTITAAADGSDYVVTVAPAATLGFAPGSWRWTAYVERGAAETLERYTLAEGVVTIKAALHAAGISDLRSHAQKVLDAIEATIEGRATQEQAELTVNGKSMSYMRHDELLRLRAAYRREVARERGESHTVRVAFGRSR